MTVPAPDLERLRELEAREGVLRGEADAVDALIARTAAVRQEATETLAALAAIPAARDELAEAERLAASRVAAAIRSRDEAGAVLAEAERSRRDRDARVAEAQADLRVAEEGVEDAERHVAQLAEAAAQLAEREHRLLGQRAALEAAVPALVAEVAATHRVSSPGVDRVPTDLAALDTWGVEARAALLVARGSIAGERERLVAEANAIGSAALGEDVGALGVSQVLRRLL